jgi:hypothetical protein
MPAFGFTVHGALSFASKLGCSLIDRIKGGVL